MRYLTKSRFKTGLECPNKLFYTKKDEYANQKDENPFLEALASGGFQVEELARLHYPNGYLVDDVQGDKYDYEQKVEETNQLLQNENVVIYEAAFKHDNLFIRVDILEKKGHQINLIEVKAKSFKEGYKEVKYNSEWRFYLFDVAFQKYVIEKAHPHFRVKPYLMLADQLKTASVDGLNQMFRIKKNSGKRTGIEKKEDQLAQLKFPEDSVLSLKDVTDIITKIETGEHRILEDYEFEDAIAVLSQAYQDDRYFGYPLDFAKCKHCEFKTDADSKDKKSGFEECFKKQLGWKEDDFKAPNAFEIWDFRRWKNLTDEGKLKLTEIEDEEFGDIKPKDFGMPRVERQLIQKHKSIEKDNKIYLDKEGLSREMTTWKPPYNFIDFEASTVALPFYSGQHPYEKVVFQFSHHIYHEDGHIEHANEFVNVNPGEFPNFEFVRALKAALEQNTGSVFQFSPYENSTLNQVKQQLEASAEPDKADLITFIKTLTTPPKSNDYKGEVWEAKRMMIDLCEVIKAYYYNPYTKGSNSIKAILPAIFKTSVFIKEKYSQPIADINLTSKNFPKDYMWLRSSDGEIQDPYKSLDKPFKDWDTDFERKSDIEEINNGGAALTAYGLTQYTDMSTEERNTLREALLKYCELDTLAMVMVFEHLREIT
ncbi:DUF2779 domain-containing protein [Mesoflavibacter zeaxanthinifaciens]|uniref:DUF2779 domain-containing protein n=1 Tax=Mesoflavibacter zeaxanthinifaciens TaxID=393060 RepID=UPI0026EDF079|nr:DUF2779 domain-containing protein [Mesoflavibacter zeaxanthinifaciens]